MSNEKKSMVAIAVNKSICKEYSVKDSITSTWSRTVYLDNGAEFQIQLFNPHKFTVAAKIYIDNEAIPNRLVLNPGERIWLERYLDTAKKFKFSTYSVDANDSDAKEAIRDNGVIKVEFYREVRKKDINLNNNIKWNYDYNKCKNSTGYSNSLSGSISTIDYSKSSCSAANTLANTVLTSSCSNFTLEPSSVISVNNLSATVDTAAAFSTSSYCSSLSDGEISTLTNYVYDTSSIPETIETGRIEEGSYSDQEFTYVNKSFGYFSFVSEQIKLLPMSQKPFSVNDLQKIYCSECGRKLNTKYKFCPYCGTKVD